MSGKAILQNNPMDWGHKEENHMAKDKDGTKKYRAHGDGGLTPRKDKDGNIIGWQGFCYYIDQATGEKKRHYESGKGQKETAQKIRDWQNGVRDGKIIPGSILTVGEWLDQWLETYVKTNTRQITYNGYYGIVNSHLKPELGGLRLTDLQPARVQKMLNDKREHGRIKDGGPLGARQVIYIYTILHKALDQALKNGLVGRNVCDAVTKPKKQRHEFKPWTIEETNTFLKVARESRFFPLYLTVWGTGLRRSEVLGLQWQDIDFKNGTLFVRRSLVPVKGGLAFNETKTSGSRRIIPLPAAVIKELKAWKVRQKSEKLAFPGEYNPQSLIFCNEFGRPTRPEALDRDFKKQIQVADLPVIRFHDLRHGHATMLLEMGEDLKTISERLGHSTITITADTYTHVREKTQREASFKLDKALDMR